MPPKAVKRSEGEPSTIVDGSDTTSGGHAAPPRPPAAEAADPFHHPSVAGADCPLVLVAALPLRDDTVSFMSC